MSAKPQMGMQRRTTMQGGARPHSSGAGFRPRQPRINRTVPKRGM